MKLITRDFCNLIEWTMKTFFGPYNTPLIENIKNAYCTTISENMSRRLAYNWRFWEERWIPDRCFKAFLVGICLFSAFEQIWEKSYSLELFCYKCLSIDRQVMKLRNRHNMILYKMDKPIRHHIHFVTCIYMYNTRPMISNKG